jgi:UDP-N-acetylglucosamine-lysosomal-enzyme
MNEIDTDRDGSIDDNEFRTLAAIVSGKILTPEAIKQYKDCAFPLLKTETVTKKEAYGVVEVSYTVTAPPTIDNIMNCSVITDALKQRMKTSSHFPLAPPTYSIGEEHDVSFEMIYDNASLTLEKLDSIRWRKNKFICINDNVENSTAELDAVLQDFFNALYPLPSSFELPPGTLNPTLYLDEYNLKYRKKNDFISHVKNINSIFEIYLLEKIIDEKFRILFLILSLVVLSIFLFYILFIHMQKGPISTSANNSTENNTTDNKTSPETTLSKAKRKMKNI